MLCFANEFATLLASLKMWIHEHASMLEASCQISQTILQLGWPEGQLSRRNFIASLESDSNTILRKPLRTGNQSPSQIPESSTWTTEQWPKLAEKTARKVSQWSRSTPPQLARPSLVEKAPSQLTLIVPRQGGNHQIRVTLIARSRKSLKAFSMSTTLLLISATTNNTY